MEMLWWHWIVFGLLLVVGELATPGGFYIIFFGVAAIVVGMLSAMGGETWLPLPLQILIFVVLSVACLLLFRARLLRWMQINPQAPSVDTLVGEIGTAAGDLAPGSFGKVGTAGLVVVGAEYVE